MLGALCVAVPARVFDPVFDALASRRSARSGRCSTVFFLRRRSALPLLRRRRVAAAIDGRDDSDDAGRAVGRRGVLLVLAFVVGLPIVSDMWALVRSERNPAAFYLVAPTLAFALLFVSMAAHRRARPPLAAAAWLRAKAVRVEPRPTARRGAAERV